MFVFVYFRNTKTILGVAWCMMAVVLFAIASLIVLALIPVYLSNRAIAVPQNPDTGMLLYTCTFYILSSSFFSSIILESDLLKIQMLTNMQYVQGRVTIQVNVLLLTTAVSQNISNVI